MLYCASHQTLDHLQKLARSMGIKRTLIACNKTRFSSVHASLESVVKLQGALQEFVKQQPKLIAVAVVATITSNIFLVKLKLIRWLLEPHQSWLQCKVLGPQLLMVCILVVFGQKSLRLRCSITAG